MLQLRPNCEYCDTDLPADTPDAMICSYECTFCADCVDRSCTMSARIAVADLKNGRSVPKGRTAPEPAL